MIEKKYKISFQEGLHARPAKILVRIAKEAQSKYIFQIDMEKVMLKVCWELYPYKQHLELKLP